jgi:hypothetical protein
MLHKYILIGLLALSGTLHAELDLFDQETPYEPLKKEHALFYSAVWTAIGGSFGYGIYLLAKTLKKPVDSNAIMNDAICAVTIAIFAKLVHHSVNEAIDGLQLYFDKDAESQEA